MPRILTSVLGNDGSVSKEGYLREKCSTFPVRLMQVFLYEGGQLIVRDNTLSAAFLSFNASAVWKGNGSQMLTSML